MSGSCLKMVSSSAPALPKVDPTSPGKNGGNPGRPSEKSHLKIHQRSQLVFVDLSDPDVDRMKGWAPVAAQTQSENCQHAIGALLKETEDDMTSGSNSERLWLMVILKAEAQDEEDNSSAIFSHFPRPILSKKRAMKKEAKVLTAPVKWWNTNSSVAAFLFTRVNLPSHVRVSTCGINSPLPLKQPIHDHVKSLQLQGARRCDRSLNSSRYVFKASCCGCAKMGTCVPWTHTFHWRCQPNNKIISCFIFLRCRRAIGCFLKEG